MSEFRELLVREWSPYGQLTEHQLAGLEWHYDQLVRWNDRMNLTRIRDLAEVVTLHYCESLYLGLKLPAGPLSIVDIGSGAGFPGVPVGILRPDSRVTLVESNHRKAVFLREACRNLKNCEILASRAQDVSSRFDWMISRAVAPKEVLELTLAPRAALLASSPDSVELPNSLITAIPWGRRRVIQLFHVEHLAC